MYTLTKAGFAKINALQDKYRFQNTIAIEDIESALEFLRDLRQAYQIGLNIDADDLKWIEASIDVLTGCADEELFETINI